jgi:hypothetical protein
MITQEYSASSPPPAQLTSTAEPDPLPVSESHISGEYFILAVLPLNPLVTEDVPAPGQTGQHPEQVRAMSIDPVIVPPVVHATSKDVQDVPVQQQGKTRSKTKARRVK